MDPGRGEEESGAGVGGKVKRTNMCVAVDQGGLLLVGGSLTYLLTLLVGGWAAGGVCVRACPMNE